MYTRRQFCGVLGGTLLGRVMAETVCANSLCVTGEKYAPLQANNGFNKFSGSKIHLEQWFGELRHQSRQTRLEELRKRFVKIRTYSEAVLFIPGEVIVSAFQNDLAHEAKEAGLRIFSPPENVDFAQAALEQIQADSSGFTTFAFPLEETCDRVRIIAPSPSQTVQGYFYVRFFHRSAITLPLAVIVFEKSRCLWKTYIFRDLLLNLSCDMRKVSRDCVDHGYARLIDKTPMVFMKNKQEKRA